MQGLRRGATGPDARPGEGVDRGDPGAQLGGERVHVGGAAGVQLGELALERPRSLS